MAIKKGLVNKPPRTPSSEFNPPTRPTNVVKPSRSGQPVRLTRKR
ncbi:hypothetical protein LCGC14_0725570 [marine sediment metagenome]|uniref:Uncharacterized protein n=1 Tax=marine sediment metagenome TaxID=412755 RepID=A0A0F9SWB7_9ZZZZ